MEVNSAQSLAERDPHKSSLLAYQEPGDLRSMAVEGPSIRIPYGEFT